MADKKPFVHLHFHTAYSLLDGLCQVEATMDRAAELGMSAVAMTDHGVMYGAIDFYKTAKAKGIKPIIGCEAYMAHGSMHEKQKVAGQKGQSFHQLLLAENEEGYQNLIHLITKAQLEGFYYKPRIDRELLAQHSKGLIATSTCFKGEIPQLILADDLEGAVELAGTYLDIMGKDNFFLELQDHGIPEQRKIIHGLLHVQKKTHIPLVATNDVHYLRKEHAAAHEVMLCLQTQTVMSDPKRMRYTSNEFYMKSGEEMWALFKDHPESLTNTVAIAERCNLEFQLEKDLHFPLYKVPESGHPKTYLTHLIKEGVKNRYGMDDPDKPTNEQEEIIKKRYLHELDVIERTGFINYFLVVWDFINYANEHKIPVGPGRGSGAGSLVAYALGITGIDPLQYNLIFERFLNPERVSPPDFDIDFCQARREEVIDYVKDKYGRDSVAQIITFGTLGAKTVIRDLGRALEIPFSYCDRLAKMVPEDPKMTLEQALNLNPEFKQAVETEEQAGLIMKYARVLEGNPRNPGIHAAGVVIGDSPLINLIPLTRDKNEEQTVTQYEMKPLEEIGLLKLDFLGLKTLTVIQEAVDHVKSTRGVDLELANLPMDDEKTFALLNRGDTVAVFQVESKGMRDLLRRIGLSRFEDLIAMIALYRPGPMNMLDDFVARKHGNVKIQYDHPLLEPILKETYGVMLYQEQVMFAANVLAGFSLGQADILRKAMGKKKPEEMARQRHAFVEGGKQTNGIPHKVAEKIFDNIERFAGYGFNKSHSAAYAILSFQTAYLKAHYPAEFMAAVCSCDMNNADKLPIFIAECQEMGLEIYPPNVNESHVRFTPENDGIRFGMAGVKNVGVAAVEAIIRERETNGPFSGLVDFCARMGAQNVNKKVVESLVKCGAFDFCGMTRGRMFNGIEFAIHRAAATAKDLQSGQTSLFDMLEPAATAASAPNEELPEADPWSSSEMLAAEKELLGFYISGHPLTEHAWEIDRFSLSHFKDLADMQEGTMTRIGGLVTQLQKRYTKKTQEPLAIFTLETLDGSLEVIAFPQTYRDYGLYLEENAPVFACGAFDKSEGMRIRAEEIYPLRDIHKHFTKRLSLHIPAVSVDDEHLTTIKDILRKYPGDTPVTLCLVFASGKKVFISADRMYRVDPCCALIERLEGVLGEESVYLDINRNPCKKAPSRGNGRRWGQPPPQRHTTAPALAVTA